MTTNNDANLLTRRQACRVLGVGAMGALGALGAVGAMGTLGVLSGCAPQPADPYSRTGYDPDTEVKTYPVHLKLYASAHLLNQRSVYQEAPDGTPVPELDEIIRRYKEGHERSAVTIEVQYVSDVEMLAMAEAGFSDGDGLICLADTMKAALKSGVADGGPALLYSRTLNHLSDTVCMVRALGSEVKLPPAATLTGKDGAAGQGDGLTQWDQLHKFEGKIAIPSEAELSGREINQKFAFHQPILYVDGQSSPMGGTVGGHYIGAAADKFVTYPTEAAAMNAVASGECQLGFCLSSMMNGRNPQHYTKVDFSETQQENPNRYTGIGGTAIAVEATNLTRSPEGGVMRDFFAYIAKLGVAV